MATISHSIPSLPSDTILRARYDHRSPLQKAIDLIISLFRQAHYSLTFLYYRNTFAAREVEWHPDSKGLVVLLHGLRSHPAAWSSQISLLDRHQKIDVFAPCIRKKGMCSLEEAANPLLPPLLDYAKKNPRKPICLLGVSNGSRIVTWLETKLRIDAPHIPIMVSTIAGVHLGSQRMNLLDKWGIGRFFYPKELQEELRYASPKAIELLGRVTSPVPQNCAKRKYEFYATTEDQSVPELDSSLPVLKRGESHHIVHGHSHDSIVDAVAKKQIASCMQWIQLHSRIV